MMERSNKNNEQKLTLSKSRVLPLLTWFNKRDWKVASFQREAWARYMAGQSGLVHTPTGSGKTLAAFGGPLLEALEAAKRSSKVASAVASKRTSKGTSDVTFLSSKVTSNSTTEAVPIQRRRGGRLQVLWVTPLRALAADTVRALREPITDLGLDWQVAQRTGDASARDKRLARKGQAEVLVITPESLSLLLSYPDNESQFLSLRSIVVDEWHELLGNKRGVLLQLSLSRLRAISPDVRIWGLSATIGNLKEARDVLLPHIPNSTLISGTLARPIQIDSLIPDEQRRLPWAGHLGLNQLVEVYDQVMRVRTSLLFTNTRAQAELWYRALNSIWQEDLTTLALHHGSLDPKLRAAAEQGLRDGTLRCVVATSSLDLGVDFPTVDQVLQIGSPKGVARLSQRAGRARHRPGESGNVICVPTQILDLLEYAAAREAIKHNRIESRKPPRLCLDVLAQHCITIALGGGFEANALLKEVRGTHAFAELSDVSWQAVLDFIVQGGRALENYPEYRRVEVEPDGRYRVNDRRVSFRHRLSIGTITSDGTLSVRMLRGGVLGSIEESFIGRLRPGDQFHFAGRLLKLVRLEGMTAYVRKAPSGKGTVPTWQGGRMSLSSELADEVEQFIAAPEASKPPELAALLPLLHLQQKWSALPTPHVLLVESIQTRRGHHLFVYPFAGRAVHEGLASLFAMRWGRIQPNTFSYSVNDYGLMLTVAEQIPINSHLIETLISPRELSRDLRESLNLSELARRQFREVARVAGLLPPSLPGRAARSLRQLQASAGLIFDVLQRYDSNHILLAQAEREVFEQQLEYQRLDETLHDCVERRLEFHSPEWLTPLSFSLWAEGFRGHLSNEDWQTRIRRAADQLEKRYSKNRRPQK